MCGERGLVCGTARSGAFTPHPLVIYFYTRCLSIYTKSYTCSQCTATHTVLSTALDRKYAFLAQHTDAHGHVLRVNHRCLIAVTILGRRLDSP